MRNLSWRARQYIRKLIPLTVIGAVLYGGYSMYRHGAFRRGLRSFPSSITAMLHRLPYFGSRFKHYDSGDAHYALAPAAPRVRGRVWRNARRHRAHGRRHRRHRR